MTDPSSAAGVPWPFWIGFNLFVLATLALDLGVLRRRRRRDGDAAGGVPPPPPVPTFRSAALWSVFWFVLALAFAAALVPLWPTVLAPGSALSGPEASLAFVTGYLIEKSLSLDNLFVILLIFGGLGIAPPYQQRALLWGIVGALAFRAGFILAGVTLVERFAWMLPLFGLFLVATGAKMGWGALRPHRMPAGTPEKPAPDTASHPALRLLRRFLPISDDPADARSGAFLVRRGGRLLATPLLVALVLVESADLVFAVDSIPAILAVTREPFLVYTANAFAILGLRALYFALAGLLPRFRYLHHALAAILTFVGAKLLLHTLLHVSVPAGLSLGVIVGVLAAAIVGSVVADRRERRRARAEESKEPKAVSAVSTGIT